MADEQRVYATGRRGDARPSRRSETPERYRSSRSSRRRSRSRSLSLGRDSRRRPRHDDTRRSRYHPYSEEGRSRWDARREDSPGRSDYDRHRRHRRDASRSPSRRLRRSTSRHRSDPGVGGHVDTHDQPPLPPLPPQQRGQHEDGALPDDEMDEEAMMRAMGIPTGFDSTKGKPVPGTDVSGVYFASKREYRQYMARRAYNKPLPEEVVTRADV